MATFHGPANVQRGCHCFALILVLVLTELVRDRALLNGVFNATRRRGAWILVDSSPTQPPIATTRSNTSHGTNHTQQSFLLYWYPEDPLASHEHSDFSYYQDIAAAVQSNDHVSLCARPLHLLDECATLARDRNMTLLIAIPHTSTTRMQNNLDRKLRQVQEQLESILLQKQHSTLCFIVVACINKVYKGLDAKIQVLLPPFVNLTHQYPKKFLWMATTWSPHAPSFAQQYGVPFVYIPFATNTTLFHLTHHQLWAKRPCHLFLRWDSNPKKYELRRDIEAFDWAANGITVQAPHSFLKLTNYLHHIQSCQMTVSTIGMPGQFDLLGTRYYEIMASNTTLLLLQRPHSSEAKFAYEHAGLVENVTFIGFDSVTELLHQIQHHKSEQQTSVVLRIIQAASQIARDRHSWTIRGREMVQAIQDQQIINRMSCGGVSSGGL